MLKVCPLKNKTRVRAFASKLQKMRILRARLIILYWLFHALGAFIELRALRALGPGSWGRRKTCFCSAAGFLLLARFYVDMLGPMFSAFGTAFILRDIQKCWLCKAPVFSPWSHESWFVWIQPRFGAKNSGSGWRGAPHRDLAMVCTTVS